jgi:hypothetical protein
MTAKDPTEGLFFHRKTALMKSFEVKVYWSNYENPAYFLTVQPPVDTRDTTQAPLRSRGWVLQEQLLAPRALLFTKHQIFWECCKQEACETYHGGLPLLHRGDAVIVGDLDFRLPIYLLKRQVSSRGSTLEHQDGIPYLASKMHIDSRSYLKNLKNRDGTWYYWRNIVEDFCSRDLTFADDRLITLAGIASVLAPKFGSHARYLAGVWKRGYGSDFTITELLWTVSSDWNLRPQRYRAPTRSWASVNGHISYFRGKGIADLGKLAHAKENNVSTVDGSMAKEVKAGCIQVEGPLVTSEAVREVERQQRRSEIADYTNSFIVVDQDCNPERLPADDDLSYLGLLESGFGFLSVRREPVHKLWCLPLLLWPRT